jgi:membrane associated rhomboid family serine protease
MLENLRQDALRLRQAFQWSLVFIGLLWIIRIAESLFGLDFVNLGVYPREPAGLVGLLTAPLVHGSFFHLISNSLPLAVLGTVLFYGYPRASLIVVPVVYIGTGLLVWIFARPSWHIGAS